MAKDTIIVTGASGNIGAAAVKQLATQGFPIVMACRNKQKGLDVCAAIQKSVPEASIEVETLDLSSIASIVRFADTIRSKNIAIYGLFNNAGIMNRHFVITQDGIENTVETNYVGPYLLTRLLMPIMSSEAHIVNMVSLMCSISKMDQRFFDLDEKSYSQLGTYGKTKLALLFFSLGLLQYSDLKVNMADPGVVNTNIITMDRWFDPLAKVLFRPFCKSPEKGAIPAVNAIMSDQKGLYFSGNSCASVKKRYINDKNIEWLWQTTEDMLRKKGVCF